jgi:K+-transporting ATPase ATPase B chain
MVSKKTKRSLWDMKIVRRALWDSIVKLHPVTMMRNPVMFVVEVGSVVTTILLVLERLQHRPGFGFNLQITLWLWFTVLFANFAEAMAEGRGKAQADALRRAKAETMANRLQIALGRFGAGGGGGIHSGRWRDNRRRGVGG